MLKIIGFCVLALVFVVLGLNTEIVDGKAVVDYKHAAVQTGDTAEMVVVMGMEGVRSVSEMALDAYHSVAGEDEPVTTPNN